MFGFLAGWCCCFAGCCWVIGSDACWLLLLCCFVASAFRFLGDCDGAAPAELPVRDRRSYHARGVGFKQHPLSPPHRVDLPTGFHSVAQQPLAGQAKDIDRIQHPEGLHLARDIPQVYDTRPIERATSHSQQCADCELRRLRCLEGIHVVVQR